jgi:acyl dehydratase
LFPADKYSGVQIIRGAKIVRTRNEGNRLMGLKKYDDDFNVGDVYTTCGITVTETHVVNWAGLTMDFYPLHMDQEYAAKTQFKERLVHGPMIFAIAIGLVNSEFTGNAAVAWLGTDNLKMLAAVKINDTIKVTVEVAEKRKTSKPGRGIQTWLYTVKNQKDVKVMVFDYQMMFYMRQ